VPPLLLLPSRCTSASFHNFIIHQWQMAPVAHFTALPSSHYLTTSAMDRSSSEARAI